MHEMVHLVLFETPLLECILIGSTLYIKQIIKAKSFLPNLEKNWA